MSMRNRCRFTGRILRMEKVQRGEGIVLNFSLAVQRRRNNKKQQSDVLDFEAWNKFAELIYNNTKVGKLIEVEGEARKDKYEYNGEVKYKHYYTVDDVDIREWGDSKKETDELEEVSNEELSDYVMNEVGNSADKEE